MTLGPLFGPALRWSTNQALRSQAVDDIVEDMRHELWHMEDIMVPRFDDMLVILKRVLVIMEKVSQTAENLQILLSTLLSSGILTNEQLGQMLSAVAAAQQTQQNAVAPELPASPAPTSSGGFQRGRRW